MKEIVVNNKYNEKKLSRFLLDTFDGLSLNTLYKTFRKKDIRINDIKISQDTILHVGDVVRIYLTEEQLYQKTNIAICIVYEDENIAIINKPVGIEVTGEHSLTTALMQYYKNLYSNDITKENRIFVAPCHRLDRNTTGLVLFAKNEESLCILLDKFKHHEIEKHYHAQVVGIPTKKQVTLTAYLFKDAKKSLVYISDTPKKGYEKIITSYLVIAENKKENTSILDVTLHTGRTHQIRSHLAHIGYPILGDR